MMEIPNQCPLCDGNWEPYDQIWNNPGGLCGEERCQQYNKCKSGILKRIKSGRKERLFRAVGEFEVCWDIIHGISYRYRYDVVRIDFDLPFDVDEERMRLLLAFS
jgi:hypothetical protein